MEATQKQIDDWKAKHGDVFQITVEDKNAYLRKPDRKTLAFAMTKAQTDPLGFAEILVNNCWLGGDEEMKTNDAYFLAVTSQLDKLVEVKTSELKKL
jgi:hypothetical protein